MRKTGRKLEERISELLIKGRTNNTTIDPNIAKLTTEIVERVKLVPVEQKFQQKIDSRQQKFLGSWAKGIKSNAMWQQGWQNNQQSHQETDWTRIHEAKNPARLR